MGILLPGVLQAKQILRQSPLTASSAASNAVNVPKWYVAVYVGESQKTRFLVPVSYLNQPKFQELQHKAEEEYGFDHPMGGLTIPCPEDTFLDITSRFILTPVRYKIMGIRLLKIVHAKRILQQVFSTPMAKDVSKGHLAVYVGETEKKRFVVPISFLKHPSFQNLLSHAEEEFGFDHPMGGLTIPCREEIFIDLTCNLNCS
ncbi:uncharacterized protein LOC132293911 [Cornus florida]|uniref:uncharacterized protein LOC132293911 n=1 Tax=Cornus florida TaxID=4283 RepID=UPI00289EAC1A|nr:uncharacterized protein LOC132293911 [Cornus florida]